MSRILSFHLIIDLYGCNEELLSNEGKIKDFLIATTKEIGMQPISEPMVLAYDHPKNPEKTGVTGVLILAESNITIHTFSRKGFAMVDINSCEEFDTDYAITKVVERLKPARYEKTFIERGIGV